MEVFKSPELKRLREDLDDLEAEGQNFSKLVSDVRRRFKDFLMTVDRINPLFVEMYIRNSWKSHQRFRDSSSTTTPYQRLRHDSFNSSEESLTERVRSRSLSKYVVSTAGEQESLIVTNEHVPKINEGSPYSCHRHTRLLNRQVPWTLRDQVQPGTDSSETDSGKFTASLSLDKSDSYRHNNAMQGKLKEEDDQNNNGRAEIRSEFQRRIVSALKEGPNYSTNSQAYITNTENHRPIFDANRPDDVFFDILNTEQVSSYNNDENNRCPLEVRNRDRNNNNVMVDKLCEKGPFKRSILDCSLSEDNVDSPLVPLKLVPFSHADGKGNVKGVHESRKAVTEDNCQRVESSDSKALRQREHPKARQTNSEASHTAYTKDQRKRLKKKMRNAFKKPENCCFMGQV